MSIPGNLLTTAMAVMPHRDVDRALELALSMDIPYWPQLPHYSYYEDMYVQVSEHFPGMILDMEQRTLRFSMEKFTLELEETMSHWDEPEYFDVSETYSAVYHRFLKRDLSGFPAIRGQLEGPISFGFNVVDQDKRPIIFDDTVRPFMIEFMARRINVQLHRLKQLNPNAFMFVDEPGLQFIFSAMSGYNDVAAFKDMETFFSLAEKPRGVHLCGNPDWDFLLKLDLDILSLDVYSNGETFTAYAPSIKKFLENGGIIIWGIVPTNIEPFGKENVEALSERLETLWESLAGRGIDRELIIKNGMPSPATCCLVNPVGEKTVEKAFSVVSRISQNLREKYHRFLN